MSVINIDIAGNISFSSNFDNDVGTDRDTPVVYQICWSSFAPAFNIALLVPKRSINGSHNNCNILANEPSLLSIVENNDSMNFQSSSDRNIIKYIFLVFYYHTSFHSLQRFSGEERMRHINIFLHHYSIVLNFESRLKRVDIQ